MAPKDADRVRHILEAIETIEERVAGLDRSDFLSDDVVHDSVLYQLAVLGEAANHLSKAVRNRHPNIPWAEIVGFRNRITHEYHSVDLPLVWSTIQKELPELKSAMRQDPLYPTDSSQPPNQARTP